jgi:hypothetical protein
VITYIAAPETDAPPNARSAVLSPPWYCLGWMDTSGYTLKPGDQFREVKSAAGSTVKAVRSQGSRSVDVKFLEALNPWARSLHDRIPLALLEPSGTQASYFLPGPLVPSTDQEYAFLFDAADGDRLVRLYAPRAFAIARGDDQVQQADLEYLSFTLEFHIGFFSWNGGQCRGSLIRYTDFGIENDVSAYFPSAP